MKMTIDLVPAHLRLYVGMRPAFESQAQKAEHMAFNLMTECLAMPDSPFVKIARNGVLLNDATEHYLYDPSYRFGFIDEPYRQGTRQILEDYIASVVKPGMSKADQVVALSQSMHYDLPRRYPKVPQFLYGESDEQTILKGGGHCSCRGRLLSALCQVIGVQARPAMMWVWVDHERDPQKRLGGHTVAEVYLDGKWGFFDPQHHLYCRTHDGSFPNILDIRRDPSLLTNMPGAVVDEMQADGYGKDQDAMGMNTYEYYWYKNFNPMCPTSISRHDVNDRYCGRWNWASKEYFDNLDRDMAAIRAILLPLAGRGELTDDIYYMNLNQFRKYFGLQGKMQTFAWDLNWSPVAAMTSPVNLAGA
jgi:hypothetical protein